MLASSTGLCNNAITNRYFPIVQLSLFLCDEMRPWNVFLYSLSQFAQDFMEFVKERTICIWAFRVAHVVEIMLLPTELLKDISLGSAC